MKIIKHRYYSGVRSKHKKGLGCHSKEIALGTTCSALFTLICLMSFSTELMAGTGGDAFSDVWDTLKEWTQGTLGRIIAGAMVLVGIVGGIARQSLMAFALGIGGGMGLYNTPTVVESVLSATLPEVIELSQTALSTVLIVTSQ